MTLPHGSVRIAHKSIMIEVAATMSRARQGQTPVSRQRGSRRRKWHRSVCPYLGRRRISGGLSQPAVKRYRWNIGPPQEGCAGFAMNAFLWELRFMAFLLPSAIAPGTKSERLSINPHFLPAHGASARDSASISGRLPGIMPPKFILGEQIKSAGCQKCFLTDPARK